DKAIQYGTLAVQEARALKSKLLLAQALANLSMSYIQKMQLDKANDLLKESLQLGRQIQDIRIEATVLLNLAGLGLKRHDFSGIRPYSQRSLEIYRQIGSTDGETVALRALALADLQEKKYDHARQLAEQALDIDRKNNYTRELASVTRLLSTIEYAAGNTRKGLEYDDESNTLLEKLIADVSSQQSAELEKKYETEKKEARIKNLEADKQLQAFSIRQKNMLNYALAGSAVVLLVIFLLFYRNHRQKQKLQLQRINELETEKKLAATEAVLKGEEQERTRLAKDLHDGLGGLLSGIKYSFNSMKGNLVMTPDNALAFERSMDMLDSSIREMRRVAHNMMPEALVKFGLDTALKDFCNDINQSGALKISYQSVGMGNLLIDQTTAITIYRIAQELVNNSIRHANARTAIVQLTRTNGQLTLTVEDDGTGFDTSLTKKTGGIGWSNIRNRVDFLKGKLDVQSTEGKGTSVMIEFNIE
ncbi:MAG: sensor histidine kinase, partial [Bacteroidetes bacterium]|nr:sensor histidine kinase [Bacteroidota bacterium]